MWKETSSELSFGVVGRLLWWTRKKSVKHSALGRLCRKGCCAVCVMAGCLSSISGMTTGTSLQGMLEAVLVRKKKSAPF